MEQNCRFCGKLIEDGIFIAENPPFPIAKFVGGSVVLLVKGDVVCLSCQKGCKSGLHI